MLGRVRGRLVDVTGVSADLGRRVEDLAAQVLQQPGSGGGDGEAAPAAGGPVENRPHETDAAGLAGQPADDLGAAAGLAEGAFDEVGVADARPVLTGETQVHGQRLMIGQ